MRRLNNCQMLPPARHTSTYRFFGSKAVAEILLSTRKTRFEVPIIEFEVCKTQFEVPIIEFEVCKTQFEVRIIEFEVCKTQFEVPIIEFEVCKTRFEVRIIEFEVCKTQFEVRIIEFEVCKTRFEVVKKQFVSTECSKAECRDWEVLFLSYLTFLTVQYRSFPITSLRELREVLTNLGVSKKQFVSTKCSNAE